MSCNVRVFQASSQTFLSWPDIKERNSESFTNKQIDASTAMNDNINSATETSAPKRLGRPVTVTVTPICSVGRRLMSADANLWVAYDALNPSKAYIFPADSTRDHVRTAFNRIAKIGDFRDTRATRLGNYVAKFNA